MAEYNNELTIVKVNDGATGKGISSITDWYLATNESNSSNLPTRGTSPWTTSVQTVSSSAEYLWNYEVIAYTTGNPTTTSPAIIGMYSQDGANAQWIELTGVTNVIIQDVNANTITPNSSFTVVGNAYNTSITTWQYSKDGGSYSTTLPTGFTRSENTVTINPNTFANKTVAIKASNGTVNDIFTITKVTNGKNGTNGTNGADGADAYTVILTNESHTFQGSTTAAVAGNTVIGVVGYKGVTQKSTTIGTITGQTSGKITASISNNGTTNTTITVSVTTALTAQQGTLTIPVTVDGKTFNKTFSWTVSRVGAKGDKGDKGDDGTDGRSITSVTAYFAISDSDSTSPEENWSETAINPTIAAPFLWSYEIIGYSDNTTSETEKRVIGTYSASNDVYELNTNVTSVYKFYEENELVFSPGLLAYHVNQLTDTGKVRIDLTNLTIQYDIAPYLIDLKSLFSTVYIRNTSNQLVPLNSVVYIDNIDTNNKKLSESINIALLATVTGYTSSGAALSGDVATNFQTLQNQLKNETVNLFATVSRQNGDNIEALAYHLLNITFGMSIDMAQFRVLSNRIEAAVNASKLQFDADNGLTITNGGIRILGGVDGATELLKYDADLESLQIVGTGVFTGDIYANNGKFSGEVNATSGTFNGIVNATGGSFTGNITASSGTIGGFTIDSTSLKSVATANNKSLIILNGANGQAYVENLEIAAGAKITDKVTIGSSIIQASRTGDNAFIQTDNFKLSHDGVIQLGSLTLDGANSTFTGNNFSITPDWSYFNNVGISGKITTSVFETNHVQSVGGSMLFRPSYHIEQYTPNGATATIRIEDALNSTSETKVGNLVKLVDSSGVLSQTIYTITAINGNIITIEAESGNAQQDAYIFIDFGDESTLLIGINSQYNKNDILLPRGLTISPIQRNSNQVYPALFLGDLSTSSISYDNTSMSGYGLYSDNVYLRGSLTTVSNIGEDLYYAGINTRSNAHPSQDKFTDYDTSPIIFWGGATGTDAENIANAPFFITQNGSLYAGQGLFEGAIITRSKIEAAELYAARIYGTNESEYGLAIYDARPIDEDHPTVSHNGIVFYDDAEKDEPIELLRIDPVSIKSHGYDFISFENGVEILSDISRANNIYTSKLLNIEFLNLTGNKIYTSVYNNDSLINNSYIEFNSNQLSIAIGNSADNAPKIVNISSTNVDIDGSGSITNTFVLGNNQMKYTPNGTIGYDLYVY